LVEQFLVSLYSHFIRVASFQYAVIVSLCTGHLATVSTKRSKSEVFWSEDWTSQVGTQVVPGKDHQPHHNWYDHWSDNEELSVPFWVEDDFTFGNL